MYYRKYVSSQDGIQFVTNPLRFSNGAIYNIFAINVLSYSRRI